MWERRELKKRARAAISANYWKCLAALLILSLAQWVLTTGMPVHLIGTALGQQSWNAAVPNLPAEDWSSLREGIRQFTDDIGTGVVLAIAGGAVLYLALLDLMSRFLPAVALMCAAFFFGVICVWDPAADALAVIPVAVVLSFLLTMVVSVEGVRQVFLLNQVEIGGCKFFTTMIREPASMRELLAGMQGTCFLRNVVTMLLRSVYIGLWTMVLVVPGLIKTYEYRMVPYLLADRPELSRKEIFALSREMMQGSKWQAFLLDVSFLGWDILSVLTLGLLKIFYVRAYKSAADGALYLALKPKEADEAA